MCDVTGRQCQHQHHCREVAKLIAVSGRRSSGLQTTEYRADVHCIVHTLSQGGAQAAQTIRMKNATDESLHSELRLKVFRLRECYEISELY